MKPKSSERNGIKKIIWYLDMICWLLSAIFLAIIWKPALFILLIFYSFDKNKL